MDETIKAIDELEAVLRILRETKKEIDQLTARKDALRDQAIRLMGDRKEYRMTIGTETVWASRITGRKRKFAVPALERRLKGRQDLLDRITKREVIPDEFERAVRTGELDPETIKEVYTELEITPYIKFGSAPSQNTW